MKRMSFLVGLLSFAVITVSWVQADDERVPSVKDRFSGRVEMGLLGVTTDSVSTGIDDRGFFGEDERLKTVNDLENNGHYNSFGTLFVLFDVNFALNDDTTVYVGTPFFDDNRQGLTAGFDRLFSDNSSLDLSLFIGERSLWKDPYVTGTPREITYSDFLGLTADYEGLLGTEMNLGYTLRYEHVNQDLAGQSDPALKRSGMTHTVKTGYNFYLNDFFDSVLTPSILAVRDAKDGDANAFTSWGTELSYTLDHEKDTLMLTVMCEQASYDETHPVFGCRRKQTEYNASCFYTLKNLLNERWYTRVGFSYNLVDSNISFFDENIFIYGVAFGYAFH